MKSCRSALCFVLLLVSCLTFASPKARNWDKVLDRYEILCQQCLELKQQADSGQEIPKHKFSKLVRELNTLKILSARVSSVSSSITGTTFCKMMGPLSVPSSTKCTVQPENFTP